MFTSTTFSQLLKLVDRNPIRKAIKAHNSDKHSKGFKTWDQFVALLFSQLSGCKSLRDLEMRYNAKAATHYHQGTNAVKRSTFSDANKNRNSIVFQEIASHFVRTASPEVKEVVRIFDSTSIRLAGRGSEWTKNTRTLCTQGRKVHVEYAPEAECLRNFEISSGNINDITAIQGFKLEAGKVYIFDKGYYDFNWWNRILSADAHFVTRIKKNAAFKIIEQRPIDPVNSSSILSDQIITLGHKIPRSGKLNLLAEQPLRLIEVKNPDDGKIYRFVSSLLDESAEKIAALYRSRWAIELLFKWLKQNLRLTNFLGENENAIRIQIYMAIVAYVLLKMFQRMCGSVFSRTIDLISWFKVSALSRHTPIKNLLNKRKEKPSRIQLAFDFAS